MTGEPPITGVTGGSHGMAVAYDHALALAGDYDSAGGRMRGWAGRSGGVLLDADLLESAALSPLSFAEAEAAVLAATSGPDGVLVASVVWEADAVTIRVAVRATQLTDELVARTWEVLDHQLGVTVGFTVSAGARRCAARRRPRAALDPCRPTPRRPCRTRASRSCRSGWSTTRSSCSTSRTAAAVCSEGLWDGLTPVTSGGLRRPPARARHRGGGVAGGALQRRAPQTSPASLVIPGSDTTPADLTALVRHLEQVDDQADGVVEVQSIRTTDGSVRHVVYLPGTDDLTTTPWSQDADVRDLGTNLRLVSGQGNAYQQGILDAMQQAGVRPGEPVALVGHSQGGMEAAAILAQGSPYAVTHVVTAGSPTAHLDGFPPGSHVLSLENRGDVVPLLDGADNPDSAEQVTVRFDDHGPSVAGNHDLAQYVHGALAVQASADPSVVEQLASLEAAGFVGSVGGQEVTSQVFQITRVP